MRISSYRTGAALVNLATQANLIATEVADTALAAAQLALAAALSKTEAGDSFSATATLVSGGAPTPVADAPINLVPTSLSGGFSLSWDAVTTLVGGGAATITGYEIYYGTQLGQQFPGGASQGAGSPATVSGSTLSFTKSSGLANGVWYGCVYAITSDGRSGPSTEIEFTVNP